MNFWWTLYFDGLVSGDQCWIVDQGRELRRVRCTFVAFRCFGGGLGFQNHAARCTEKPVNASFGPKGARDWLVPGARAKTAGPTFLNTVQTESLINLRDQ